MWPHFTLLTMTLAAYAGPAQIVTPAPDPVAVLGGLAAEHRHYAR